MYNLEELLKAVNVSEKIEIVSRKYIFLKLINIILSFLFLSQPSNCYAQEASFYGARNESLARSTIALKDSWSLFYNPSGFSDNHSEFLVSYQNKYISLGINDIAFGYIFPVKNINIGVGTSYFGDYLLNKSKIITAIAHKIGKVSLGLKTTYSHLKVNNLRSKGIFYIDIGGQISINEKIAIGMVINNLNQTRFDTVSFIAPYTMLQVGVSYHPHKKLLVLVQVDKDISMPIALRFGIEYSIAKNVVIRTGILPSPSSAFVGIGFNGQKVNYDIVGSYKQLLGWSAGVSMGVSILQ